MPRTLKVLVVDDSATARGLLEHMINSAPDMQVVGLAKDGQEALQMTCELQPDVILMDVIMPGMDGLEATREIMHAAPTPIVLISASLESHETDIAFRAMSLGALAVHRKPNGLLHADHESQAAALLTKLRLMADIRVIRHRKGSPGVASKPGRRWPRFTTQPEIIAIVASTGGPAALVHIVQQLPAKFPIPIVIVQHISPDFVSSMQSWMARMSSLWVTIAQPGEHPTAGSVYLAPGGKHLRLTRNHCFDLDEDPGSAYHVPSGDVLLESVAETYGKHAVGVVLTGIGDDGACGLRAMYDAGAFTIAQDEATSAVYGMPKSAYDLGAVRQVLPLPDIASTLIRLSEIKETIQ